MPASTETGQAVRRIQEDGRENLSDPNLVKQYGSNATPGGRHCLDHLTFSEDDRKACGVSDDEVLVFPARNEATGWQGKRRMAQVRHKYGAARQVLYTEGPKKGQDPYEHSHNMAVAVPREAYERIEAERQQRAKDYIATFRPMDADSDSAQEFEREIDVFEKTAENFRRRRKANSAMFKQMGIGEGSPTSRMSFEEGLAYYERRGVDIEALEDRARRNGRRAPGEDGRANFRRVMGIEPAKTITSGFGAEVNPRSALGQIQQKNARNQAASR